MPKDLGKMTQMAKNTKDWLFFVTMNTPPCQPTQKLIKKMDTEWHSYYFVQL